MLFRWSLGFGIDQHSTASTCGGALRSTLRSESAQRRASSASAHREPQPMLCGICTEYLRKHCARRVCMYI